MKHKENSEVFSLNCQHSMLASVRITRENFQGIHPLQLRMNAQQMGACINQSVVGCIKLKLIKYALNIKQDILVNKIINNRFSPNFLLCYAQHVCFGYLE